MKSVNKLSAAGLAACLILGLGSGCGKKEEAGAEAPAAAAAGEAGSVSQSGIPGANEALTLIDKGDFQGGMASIIRIKQATPPGEAQAKFAILADEARIRFLDAAPTNPKAAEALQALRQITAGR